MVKKQSQADVRSFRPSGQQGDLVYSVQRALSVLNLVAAYPQGLSACEISMRLCLNISTCYHVLNTLRVSGYLDRHPQSLAKQEDVTAAGSKGEVLTTAFTSTTLVNRMRPIL